MPAGAYKVGFKDGESPEGSRAIGRLKVDGRKNSAACTGPWRESEALAQRDRDRVRRILRRVQGSGTYSLALIQVVQAALARWNSRQQCTHFRRSFEDAHPLRAARARELKTKDLVTSRTWKRKGGGQRLTYHAGIQGGGHEGGCAGLCGALREGGITGVAPGLRCASHQPAESGAEKVKTLILKIFIGWHFSVGPLLALMRTHAERLAGVSP